MIPYSELFEVELENHLEKLEDKFEYKRGTTTGLQMLNAPLSFDIETTSWKHKNGDQTLFLANMYVCMVSLDGMKISFRYWHEFQEFCEKISQFLFLGKNQRKRKKDRRFAKRCIVIYVHNLGYEFEFIRDMFTWESKPHIFAKTHSPIAVRSDLGIEFRCSYIASGLSLAKVGENLQTPIQKSGDLDYEKWRHNETPLTGKEWGYCETDLDIVDAWVQEQIDYYGSVFEIPYTNTGIVRRELKEHIATRGEEVTEAQRRKNIFAWNDANARHWKMTPNDYEALRLAFMGGYTHGTYRHFNRVIEMVTSYDFTSSYPAVMLMEKFPMGTPVKVDPKKFSIPRIYNELDNPQKNEYAYIVMAQFHGLRIRSDVADAPLSKSKAYIKLENGDWVKPKNDNQNMEIFNGRIISADTIATVATEQDLLIFRDAYEWDSVETIWVRRMIKNYLPIELFEVILDLYYKKNTLKGVVGKEQEYMRSKGMLNSVYGMCVTRKDKDTVSYFGDWDIEKGDTAEALAEAMEKYNKSIHTVHNFQSLFYAWGVWVTAYARRNLWTGIKAVGHDFVYADTDSIKIVNAENHQGYIEAYNEGVKAKLKKSFDHYKIPIEFACPDNKWIGVWDFDGFYTRFKHVGAKRYLVEYENGNMQLTCAGVQKKAGLAYLQKGSPDNTETFEKFNNELEIPAGETGKSTRIIVNAIDDQAPMTDYLGKTKLVPIENGIHLAPSSYTMSEDGIFMELLQLQLLQKYGTETIQDI